MPPIEQARWVRADGSRVVLRHDGRLLHMAGRRGKQTVILERAAKADAEALCAKLGGEWRFIGADDAAPVLKRRLKGEPAYGRRKNDPPGLRTHSEQQPDGTSRLVRVANRHGVWLETAEEDDAAARAGRVEAYRRQWEEAQSIDHQAAIRAAVSEGVQPS